MPTKNVLPRHLFRLALAATTLTAAACAASPTSSEENEKLVGRYAGAGHLTHERTLWTLKTSQFVHPERPTVVMQEAPAQGAAAIEELECFYGKRNTPGYETQLTSVPIVRSDYVAYVMAQGLPTGYSHRTRTWEAQREAFMSAAFATDYDPRVDDASIPEWSRRWIALNTPTNESDANVHIIFQGALLEAFETVAAASPERQVEPCPDYATAWAQANNLN